MAFSKKKNGKTMSGFLRIRDFFFKIRFAEETGDPLILTCLVVSSILVWIHTLVVFDHEILIMKYFHRPGHSPADSRRAIVSYKPKYVHMSTGLSPLF